MSRRWGGPECDMTHLTRKRRLADLPRSQNGDHGKGTQSSQEGVDVLLAVNHQPTSYQDLVGD